MAKSFFTHTNVEKFWAKKAGVRTRAIERRLKKVQELPAEQSVKMIDEIEESFASEDGNDPE